MGSGDDQSEFATFSTATEWVDLAMCLACIACAGLAAGLTIGLVSIDHKALKLLTINGTATEKAQAAKILPLIKDHHWLLVTLFLFNAMANEALPVFLSALVPEYVAIVLSTFCVLLFGEIIPSSVFSGPKQLMIAARLAWVVELLLILFYVVARPIGLFLDWWLGKHDDEDQAPFNARDLYTLLSLSRESVKERMRNSNMSRDTKYRSDSETRNTTGFYRAPSILNGESLDGMSTNSNYLSRDAVTIAQGAIVSSRKRVLDVCKTNYQSRHSEELVTLEWLEAIGRTGISRILIEENGQKLNYFVVKELFCSLSTILGHSMKVKDLPKHPVMFVTNSCNILDGLNKFQNGVSRVGAVTAVNTILGANIPAEKIVGYFTMEDMVEAIIQEDIHDEKDSKHHAAIINAMHALHAKAPGHIV